MKEQPMRWVLGSLMVLALAPPALAADLDILRGSQPIVPLTPVAAPVMTVGPATFTRWSGFYVGGDFSFNYSRADFTSATAPLVELSLQDTVVQQLFQPSQLQSLGISSANAFGFGGFLGYNIQWQDLVTSLEATYTHTSLGITGPSSPAIFRSFNPPAGNVTSVTLGGTSGHFHLTDYAEVRARAGWVVGNLLPYGFVGFVAGHGDYSVSAQTGATCALPNPGECLGFPITSSASLSDALLYGYSAGAGLDWALTPNVFVRGEFEFVQFAPIANISVIIVNARAGAGFKF